MALLGRVVQVAAIEALLRDARDGAGRALVLRGDPGVGLTSLLGYAVDSAEAVDMRVFACVGVEDEKAVPYAALQRLLTPELMPSMRHKLRDAHRQALEHALGYGPQAPGRAAAVERRNGHVVAFAVLLLLSAAAAERPVLVAVDDLVRLDEQSAFALGFVARRLGMKKVAMICTSHGERGADMHFALSDELAVGVLSDRDAQNLIKAQLGSTIDTQMYGRIFSETDGNPLAIVGLPRDVLPNTAAVLGEPLQLGKPLASHFVPQLQSVSPRCKDFLVLAATSYDHSATLFWPAAERLGLDANAGEESESTGLIRLTPRLAFASSLLRAAVYSCVSQQELRRAHTALAEAADTVGDHTRSVCHRAAAARAPDEQLASALAHEAEDARLRGDVASVPFLLEFSASLTPGPALRGARLLEAAQARLVEGSVARAASLTVEATGLPLSALDRALVESTDAFVAYRKSSSGEGVAAIVRAAKEIALYNEDLGRESLLSALEAAIYVSASGRDGALIDVARLGLTMSKDEREGVADLLLYGLSLLFVSGYALAAPVLARAFRAIDDDHEIRWSSVAGLAALELWNDDALARLVRILDEATSRSPAVPFDIVRCYLAGLDHIVAGRFRKAAEQYRTMRALAEEGGHAPGAYLADAASVIVIAWRGQDDAHVSIERLSREAVSQGLGRYYALSQYALAVLYNADARYEEALFRAEDAVASGHLYIATSALAELVEAATRTDAPDKASAALAELTERTLPSGTDWALGTLARTRALVAEGPSAGRLYIEAVERLSNCRALPQLARAHLLYGEWLRRQRRRRDAREHLRRAHGMFVAMSADAFAARALGELEATGEHVQSREGLVHAQTLTAQERRIAALAGSGASNIEIGAALFISARTVEYHLHKIYRKLGVSSRTALAHWLLDHEGTETT